MRRFTQNFARRAAIAIASLGLLVAAPRAFASGAPTVAVELAPEQLAYRTYPKGQPPKEIAHEEHQTVQGYCDTEFAHECRIAYTHARVPTANDAATVTHIRIHSSLTVTIWTEEGSDADVMRHEEAHRAIAGYYHALTEAVGRKSAEPFIGRKIAMPRGTLPSGESGPMAELQNLILDEITRVTSERCSVAQDKFDRYTYGQPPDVIDQALRRAIAEEEAEHAASARAAR